MSEARITEDEIAVLVTEFYRRVRDDSLLGPIFEGAIDDWPVHLEKLAAFWSSVMLGSGRYKGQPMAAHIRHEQQMTPQAFARWLALWKQTADDLLVAGAAAAFQEKALRIAESLQLGIRFARERNIKPGI